MSKEDAKRRFANGHGGEARKRKPDMSKEGAKRRNCEWAWRRSEKAQARHEQRRREAVKLRMGMAGKAKR